MSDFTIALITAPNAEEAKHLATGLVTEKLAACVNIISGIQSIYRWQGEIHTDQECLLVCKTSAKTWDELRDWVLTHHSYDVPEVIQIAITEGAAPYLSWITQCLEK